MTEPILKYEDDDKDFKCSKCERTWDAGFGPLWVYEEPFGILGVIRAKTWEEAYECALDEIMDGCTYAEMVKEAGLTPEDEERIRVNGLDVEGYEWRTTGVPSSPWAKGEIATPDLNYSGLRLMNSKDAEEVGFEWVEKTED